MKKLCVFFLLLGFGMGGVRAADEARLLRFPTIFKNQVVFTYAGDLYTVPVTGGIARKITNDEGYEMFARFSPNGEQIAFTAQYDGNTEVYVMPANGGVPRRLTHTATLGRDDVSDRMGPNNIVMGWKQDNQSIVFRSRMREFNSFKGQLFTVTLSGDVPEQMPLPRGGFCSYSPDNRKLAYNRVFREFRTWKRYRGGMADDIWIYDFATKETENITNHPAQDIIPMWIGNRIYFLSDRDDTGRMNLYFYNLLNKETRKITDFVEFDVKFPSADLEQIVFENAGYLYVFNTKTDTYRKIDVILAEDLNTGRGGIVSVKDKVTNYEISPDGNRALFGARGDVFTVPAKNGVVRNLTQTSDVHERNSKWSPDGKWIAYLSDASGENEIYIAPQDGSGAAQQLTSGADTYYYQLEWSPDSKKILWADKKLRLRYVEIATKKIIPVAQNEVWEFNQYLWSPDSRWIAYASPEAKMMNKIKLYDVDSGKTVDVTDGWHASGSPCFSADGKYLFFVSARSFSPTYGQTEFNHIYQDMSAIYLVTLEKATESPFRPKSDEVKLTTASVPVPESQKKEPETKAPAQVTIKVDPDGLFERTIALPVKPSNYRSLASVDERVYYIRSGSKDEKPLLLMYDLKEQKETELGQINGYEISADRKKMLVSQEGSYAIIDLPKAKIEIKEKLDLSGLEITLDRQKEWAQIFEECWRQMRDFFYAPNMHGVDWLKMREKYRPMVQHVNHRADLTYVIGEMLGELNVGHAYVGGGEMPNAPRFKTGLLGAELIRDSASGFYKIAKILQGANWDKSLRSPLTEIGVDAKEGDYILAVDGVLTKDMSSIYAALVNKADKQVKIKLNSTPSETGSREVIVIPIADEADLYYFKWVQSNLKKVDQATQGQVGYLHIPDMGVPGLNEFVKYFYPQVRKKALIIDVRGNGGGNVSPMIIERLRRDVAMIDLARNSIPTPDPSALIAGPKVCLLDEFSASDGDLFPYRFKKYELGPLIGKRSWGGVVGIRGTLPLLDGGYLNRPEFASFDTEGTEWIIEGRGVEPDIVVDNDPAKEFAGEDQQLDKAIEVILEKLAADAKTLPAPPPYPIK